MNDFIAVDFETATYSRLACQIGITVVRDGMIVETITRYIQPPQNHYDAGCQRVHHITQEMTVNAPSFADIWKELGHYFTDAPEIWAHNADFDSDVLFKNMMEYDLIEELLDALILGKFHCTMKLYDGKSLKTLCQDFNIDTSGHHDAGFDAECCARFRLNYMNGISPRKDPFSAMDDQNNPLRGARVFIGGNFQTMSRAEMFAIVGIMGATIEKSISKAVDFAIIGKDVVQSHIDKIARLKEKGYGIRVIDEEYIRCAMEGDFDFANVKNNPLD